MYSHYSSSNFQYVDKTPWEDLKKNFSDLDTDLNTSCQVPFKASRK